jgi:hypothetical protein
VGSGGWAGGRGEDPGRGVTTQMDVFELNAPAAPASSSPLAGLALADPDGHVSRRLAAVLGFAAAARAEAGAAGTWAGVVLALLGLALVLGWQPRKTAGWCRARWAPTFKEA